MPYCNHMENNNGLDLTLSLPCGGPSTTFKGQNVTRPEIGADESDRGSKLIDEFKHFLDGGNQKIDSVVFSQGSNPPKPEANLFYDLSRANANVDSSSNINSGGFWGKNESISTEIEEDRRIEAGSKRKDLFDELNHQKRHERDNHLADLHDKAKRQKISIATDENSAAENEDVADSEAEGSTSKLVEHQNDKSSKIYTRNVGLSEGTKEVHGVFGHVSYGVPFSGQSVNILNMPYPLSANESISKPGVMQVVAPATNVRPGTQQPVVPANMSLMFGYSPVQMPSVEPVNAQNPFDRAKDDAKEEGSSSHTEGDVKGINGNDKGGHETAEVSLSDYPAIKPGIAAELKFGGSGSSPNLPWVSTMGPGPHGKTISGVTYRHRGAHIRIVCACHGAHMSPEEFIQHAAEEPANPNGEAGSNSAQAQG